MYPGPYMILTPALPNDPTAGTENANGLKYFTPCGRPGVPSGTFAYGFPTTSIRAPLVGVPVKSTLLVVLKPGVNGEPELIPVIPEKFQPSVIALTTLLCVSFLPICGTSYAS